MRKPRTLLAIAAMIGLVGLVGCGNGINSGRSDTALPEGFTELTAANMVDELTNAMTAAGSATFEATATESGADATFEGQFRLHAKGMDLRMDGQLGPEGEISSVLLDGTFYLRISGLDLPAGKTWLRISTADLTATPELKEVAKSLSQSADPVASLGLLDATYRRVRQGRVPGRSRPGSVRGHGRRGGGTR